MNTACLDFTSSSATSNPTHNRVNRGSPITSAASSLIRLVVPKAPVPKPEIQKLLILDESHPTLFDLNAAHIASAWNASALMGWTAQINHAVLSSEYVESSLELYIKSAFMELEALRSDERPFRRLLAWLRESEKIPKSSALADRLEELLAYYKEDYDGNILSVSSLRGLMSFLANNEALRCPSITATPSGNLYAEWFSDDRRSKLSINFLQDQVALFFLLKPNEKHQYKRDYFQGSTTVDTLLDTLKRYDAVDWLSE